LVIETLGIFRFVSIPSRRVGDAAWAQGRTDVVSSFHPLKAGRRLGKNWLRAVDSEFPSPQGGSETKRTLIALMEKQLRFHPLKAGRRLAADTICPNA
jgi:hypothetical protein